MKIWILKRKKGQKIGWDEYLGFIVRADTAKQAREIALKEYGRGGHEYEIETMTVREVKVAGKANVIMDSFNAG